MTETDRQPRLSLWMTVCAVPALVVLLGLGTWQLQRLGWKEDLIAERTARLAMPAVSLSAVPADGWREFELRRVELRGRFLHDRTLEIANRTLRGRAGVHLVVPLALADGSGTVLVNRGWAPPERARRVGDMRTPHGTIELRGILRAGGRTGPWVPDNDPAKGIWFYADPPAMAAEVRLGDARPYIVEAVEGDGDAGYPVGSQTVVTIRNNHLQYSITWYGIAAALVVIYVLYHRRRRG